MRLTINGEDRTIETAATVADLLGELGITATKVAVERNLEIVPKTAYGDTALADGDKLEIVHLLVAVPRMPILRPPMTKVSLSRATNSNRV